MTLEAFAARFPGWTCRDHLARADTLGKLYNDYEAGLADYIQSCMLPPGRQFSLKKYDRLALTCNALGWARDRRAGLGQGTPRGAGGYRARRLQGALGRA